jgi:hypothetical protein
MSKPAATNAPTNAGTNTSSNTNQPAASNTANMNHAATNTSAANKPIVGNKESMLYHKPGCPSYDKVAPKNRVEFPTVEAAEKAGYKKAGDCP